MTIEFAPKTEQVEQTIRPSEIPTEHPHIIRIESEDWYPMLRGSRIPVWLVAQFYKKGDKPEDIVAMYPHLLLTVVYDAISYYLDHTAEIEQEIEANKLENVLKELNGRIMDGGFIEFDAPNKNE